MDSCFWYKKIWKTFILLSLTLVATINIVPILNGSTLFGKNSQFSPTSSFILDISYERKLLKMINPDDFLMVIPGNGNFDHPSGRVGFIDPLFNLHKNVISYNDAINDRQSKYHAALKIDDYNNLKNVNVIVLRNSEKFTGQSKIRDSGFLQIYEDQYTSIFRAMPKPISLTFNEKFLLYIVLIGILIYGFLAWLIYLLFNENN